MYAGKARQVEPATVAVTDRDATLAEERHRTEDRVLVEAEHRSHLGLAEPIERLALKRLSDLADHLRGRLDELAQLPGDSFGRAPKLLRGFGKLRGAQTNPDLVHAHLLGRGLVHDVGVDRADARDVERLPGVLASAAAEGLDDLLDSGVVAHHGWVYETAGSKMNTELAFVQSVEEAKAKAAEEIGDYWQGQNECGINHAELLVVEDKIDLSAYLTKAAQTREAARKVKEAKDREKAELETLERLAKKVHFRRLEEAGQLRLPGF